MALKICPLCQRPYGKGRGSKVLHNKQFHPEEYRKQFEAMVAGRNRKEQESRPPPPVVAKEKKEEPLEQLRLPGDVFQEGAPEGRRGEDDELNETGRAWEDFLLSDSPGGDGKGAGGNGHDKGASAGGVVPKTPRTTKVLSEASGVAFVPRVYTVSSATVFQAREICIKVLGWPADWSFEDWLDTFCYQALKTWGVLIAPYVVLPQEEAKDGDKIAAG